MQKRDHARTQSACRARAGNIGDRGIDAGDQVFKPALQKFVCIDGHALLGAVHRRRAARAEQRIIHIARTGDGQIKRHSRRQHARDRTHIRSDRFHTFSIRIQKPKADCRRHADTHIVGGAAADAQQNFPRAARTRVQQHFAHAIRGCVQRIARAAQQRKPRRLRHFDYRRTGGQHSIARAHGFAQRPRYGDFHHFAAQQAHEAIRDSLAAIRHGQQAHIRAGIDFQNRVARDFAHLICIQRALERIGRDQDIFNLHIFNLRRPSNPPAADRTRASIAA